MSTTDRIDKEPSEGDAPDRPMIALIVCPDLNRRAGTDASGRTLADRVAEAVGLAESIGLEVAGAETVRIPKIRAATLLGTGTIERLKGQIEETGAGLLIMDSALGPVQQRNLERALKVKVIDRTGLILEIFGERAATHEGRLQVELAALTYERSRLVRSWTHLERQRGGLGKTGGPGESQLEIDRRLADERIVRLKRELEQVKRTRGLHRAARDKIPFPVVALVGYTNAGKSTLFNQLTSAGVLAEDKLFATLDPTMRRIALPGGRDVILSDTVGFISNLPTQLVAAFRATLEEVQAADLILHVRDAASPDSEAQRRDVEAVLKDLGVEATPQLVVMNKADKLAPEARAALENQCARSEGIAVISALSGEGLDALRQKIVAGLANRQARVAFAVPAGQGDALAWLHRHAQVERIDQQGEVLECTVRIAEADSMRFASRFSIQPHAA
jgi:GTPase